MASTKVSSPRDAAQVGALLDSPEIVTLIHDLEVTRWTGRPGSPIRAMVGLALIKSVYQLPTWTRTVAQVCDNPRLQDVLGTVPSIDAAYRFTRKLRANKTLLTVCIEQVLAALHEVKPEMGKTVAFDGNDLPAYANGQKYVSKCGALRKKF